MDIIEVTPAELGQIFFIFSFESASDFLENKEYIKTIGVEGVEHDYLFKEIITISMFAVVYILPALKDRETEKEVFDVMHEMYFEWLRKFKGYNEQDIKDEYAKISDRYLEYQRSIEEADSNWLLSIAKHMLNNLRAEEVRNFFGAAYLIIFFSGLIKSLVDIIRRYKIVK